MLIIKLIYVLVVTRQIQFLCYNTPARFVQEIPEEIQSLSELTKGQMKIIADKRIRQYELTFLLPVSLTTDEVKSIHEKIESLVKKHKGEVKDLQEWGKKTLAYAVRFKSKPQHEANFFHFLIELDSTQVQALEKAVKLEPMIMRHLLVLAQPETTPLVKEEKSQTAEGKEVKKKVPAKKAKTSTVNATKE